MPGILYTKKKKNGQVRNCGPGYFAPTLLSLTATALELNLIPYRVPQRSPWEQAEVVDEGALFDSHQESD